MTKKTFYQEQLQNYREESHVLELRNDLKLMKCLNFQRLCHARESQVDFWKLKTSMGNSITKKKQAQKMISRLN